LIATSGFLRTFDHRHLPQGLRLGAAGRSYLSVGFSKKTYYYIEQRRAVLWDILIGRRCSQTRLPPESRLYNPRQVSQSWDDNALGIHSQLFSQSQRTPTL
jgi:hypothetical protein